MKIAVADFYEDDEDPAKVRAAFDRAERGGFTAPPDDWTDDPVPSRTEFLEGLAQNGGRPTVGPRAVSIVGCTTTGTSGGTRFTLMGSTFVGNTYNWNKGN